MPPFAPNGSSHNGSGPAATTRQPSGSATVNLAVDNMIRNQLKVSDVRDPKQIAAALLDYYRDLPVAAAVRQEAEGLPFLQAPPVAALPPPQPTSSDAEFRIADNDVEKALQDLTTSALTVDVVPEMQGWADSIRNAIAQGYAAARQGLDPTQRDKVIAIRRQLGEYGRMARFVGTLSPGMTPNYRRLGQALDETSAVLLVMLGESLASVGFASGYYLLQVPLAELQQRRDAVIFALRNFMGGAQQAYGPDDWPRGIDAYRRLYNWLEKQGQGDLRSLLIENEIAQIMDGLIGRAQNGTAEGLRALGVTAQLDIERFRRMAIVAPGAMRIDGQYDRSPPLEAYLQALELFADTFTPAGGLRLLRIARPPILYYGIYNPTLLEDDRDLVSLIMIRGNFATIFDGLSSAGGAPATELQVLFDMLLLELDRGIDLVALDADPQERGPTIMRAAAYWYIVGVILTLATNPRAYFDPIGRNDYSNPFTTVEGGPLGGYVVTVAHALPSNVAVGEWVFVSPRDNVPTVPPGSYLINGTGQGPSKDTFTIVVPHLPPTVHSSISGWGGRVTLTYLKTQAIGPIAEFAGANPWFHNVLTGIAGVYKTETRGIPEFRAAVDEYRRVSQRLLAAANPHRPGDYEGVLEELRVQDSLEERWRNLVRTVAPEAGEQDSVFALLRLVVRQAQYEAGQSVHAPAGRSPYGEPLPPQFEQSLAEIVRSQFRKGSKTLSLR